MSSKDKALHRLFVYGTLRPRATAPTHILEDYLMMDAGAYPYIVPVEGEAVTGNLIEVTDEELADMDRYEGVDRGLYTRELLEVRNLVEYDGFELNAKKERAYVYVAGPSWPRPVFNGDWYLKGD